MPAFAPSYTMHQRTGDIVIDTLLFTGQKTCNDFQEITEINVSPPSNLCIKVLHHGLKLTKERYSDAFQLASTRGAFRHS